MTTSPFTFWIRYLLFCLRRTVLASIKPSTHSMIVGLLMDAPRSKLDLMVENAFLRQQLLVLQRSVKRPRLSPRDRLWLVVLASKVHHWKDALQIVQPDTVLRWHRDVFRWLWRWKSATAARRPRLSLETIALIRRMITENWLWGAERIRGELLKLGICVSKHTIQRYMRRVRPSRPRGQTWATFLANQAAHIWACDFVQTYDLLFRAIFVFVIIEHQSRRVIHVGVTRAPSDGWVAQQLKEATAFGVAPHYLLHDNDGKYGSRFTLIASSTQIQEVCIPPQSPNLNARCERFIGSLRRECLDHILILNERQLRHVLTEYLVYFNQARPHQGIGQQRPEPASELTVAAIEQSTVVAFPVLGGLHHDYRRAA